MFGRRSQHDFEDEIRSHLQMEVERLKRQGMSPADAERLARRSFGNVGVAEDRFYRRPALRVGRGRRARPPSRVARAASHAGLSRHRRRHARARDRRRRRDVQRRQHGHARAAAVPETRSARVPRGHRARLRSPRALRSRQRVLSALQGEARSFSTASSSFGAGTSTFRAGDRVERIPMAWPTNDMYATLGVRPQRRTAPGPDGRRRRRGDQRPAVEQLVRARSVGHRQMVLRLRQPEAGHRRHAAGVPASRATRRCSGSLARFGSSTVRPGSSAGRWSRA